MRLPFIVKISRLLFDKQPSNWPTSGSNRSRFNDKSSLCDSFHQLELQQNMVAEKKEELTITDGRVSFSDWPSLDFAAVAKRKETLLEKGSIAKRNHRQCPWHI